MATIGDWFWVTIGMHRLAQTMGHLWGRIPTQEVGRAVADALEVGGQSVPRLIAERIASVTEEAFPDDLPGITGPGYICGGIHHLVPELGEVGGEPYLVQTLGGALQVLILGSPQRILMCYRHPPRFLSLRFEEGIPTWRDAGVHRAQPRDYARLFRLSREAGWWPEEPPGWWVVQHWPPIPSGVYGEDVYGEEWQKYMVLDLPLMFMSPKTLDAPADGGSEEVEA